MKKYFLLSLLAMLQLTLTVSAQTNTYAMVIEMQNGTKLTIGPNEVKNVTFNNGELTVTGETIETLVASAVNEARQYTDQATANLKAYIDLSRELAELKASSEAADAQLANSINANKTEAAVNLKGAVDAITAELAAKQTLIETNDAAIKALLDTKISELSRLIEGNAADIIKNARDITTQGSNLMQAIKDQAGQDAAAWTAATNLAIENLVTTYQLNAMRDIISSAISNAILDLIQTYNLQKP